MSATAWPAFVRSSLSAARSAELPTATAPRRSIKELLLPLFIHVGTSAHNLRADSAGFWRVDEGRYWLPRFVFRGTHSEEPTIKLAIFAGIHGDETAGVLALIDFLRFMEENPFLGRAYHLYDGNRPSIPTDDGLRRRFVISRWEVDRLVSWSG